MAEKETRSGRSAWARVWQALALIFAFYVVEQDVEALLWSAHRLPGAGTLGAGQTELAPAANYGPGYVTVQRVEPGSPLAKAGAAAGDHLRFGRPHDYLRYPRAGETFGVTLDHGGRKTHVQVTATPRAGPEALNGDYQVALYNLSCLIPALFAVFILLRSRGQAVALLLGAALVCFSLAWPYPQMWEGGPETFPLFFGVAWLNAGMIFPLFIAFSMRFAEVTLGRLKSWEWGLFTAFTVAALLLATCVSAYCRYNVAGLPVIGDGSAVILLMSYLAFAASFYYMIKGLRRSDRAERKRYALMLTALASVMVAQSIVTILYFGMGDVDVTNNPVQYVGEVLTGVVAPVLFTYAILRHKVLDLGFAINRTLVYSVISAVLLAAFGLIEWAVDHFVPIEGREKNALIDAAIALGVFLTFHRVRDVVEHVIESLFFRRWQQNEAALKRFVREAAFVTRSEALTRAFVGALTRFGDGAEAALYLRSEQGEYRRGDGALAGAPEVIDIDAPALVTLRAERRPLELDGTGSSLGAALAAPMVNRNEVIGFVLLGPKPTGHDYRPDEVELLGWATTQVGLDLHALKVEQLEAAAASQRQEIAALKTLILRPA